MIAESIFFGCQAWIEENGLKSDSNSKYVTKGNFTEQALLKFLIKNLPQEVEKLQATKIEVLHWIGFNSTRNRSTLVCRFIKDDKEERKQEE